MQAELDLSGPPAAPAGPPGLGIWPKLIDTDLERCLIRRIDAADLAPFRFQGWLGKRLTRSFGWTYDFDSGSFERGEPMPRWLEEVRMAVAGPAGLRADGLVQALLIRYDPGAGIGWHRDRPVYEHVVDLSLGNPATLRLRRRRPVGFDRVALDLPRRSLYRLSGEVRSDWEHSIAAMTVPRWSITFRSLVPKPARRLATP